MLTARTDDLDQVLGLEMGADDYMSKPVRPRVLLARIRALLRRISETSTDSAAATQSSEEPVRLVFNNLVVDRSRREAWLDDDSIDLTSAEFDLLWLLASNSGRVLSREEIFTSLRGLNTTDRTGPLTFGSRASGPRLGTILCTPGASRRCGARATCS